ncbi:MAG: hypothetical protein ACPGSC_02480, partial [Granulosicoccaceae bacterium]
MVLAAIAVSITPIATTAAGWSGAARALMAAFVARVLKHWAIADICGVVNAVAIDIRLWRFAVAVYLWLLIRLAPTFALVVVF